MRKADDSHVQYSVRTSETIQCSEQHEQRYSNPLSFLTLYLNLTVLCLTALFSGLAPDLSATLPDLRRLTHAINSRRLPLFQAGDQLFLSPSIYQPGVPLFHPGHNRSATSTAYVVNHQTTSTIRSTGTPPVEQSSRRLVGSPDGWLHSAITLHTWYTARFNVLITLTVT